MKKRAHVAISWILTVALVLTTFPFLGMQNVYGAEAQPGGTVWYGSFYQDRITDPDEIDMIEKEAVFSTGNDAVLSGVTIHRVGKNYYTYYRAKPIQWRILKDNGSSYTMISAKNLETMAFGSDVTSMHDYWDESDARIWLNNAFYPVAFTQEEREDMVTNSVSYYKQENGKAVECFTSDKVYLLDKEELSLVGTAITAEPTDYAAYESNSFTFDSSDWWLRGNYQFQSGNIQNAFVSETGEVLYFYPTYSKGIRPVIEVKKGAKGLIYEEPGYPELTSGDKLHAPDHEITEDELFGKYYHFLYNKYYNKMTKTLIGDMEQISFGRNKIENGCSVLIGNMKSGAIQSIIRAFYADVTGKYMGQAELEESLALAYLSELSKSDKIATEAAEAASEELTWSKDIYKIIKSGYTSEAEKEILAKALSKGVYSKKEVTELIKGMEENWKDIDKAFDKAGYAVNVAEVTATVVLAAQIEHEMVKHTMELIDEDTALYRGLSRVAKKQKNPAREAFIKLFVDDVCGYIADEVRDKGIGTLAELLVSGGGPIKPGMATTVASIGYYVVGSLLNQNFADSNEVVKAYLAIENIGTLDHAISLKYQEIADNANYDQGKSIKKLKSDYMLLYNSYLQCIKTSVDGSLKVAMSSKKKAELNNHYNLYKSSLTGEQYLKSCLTNANAAWMYTVRKGKAAIRGYVDYNGNIAQKPAAKGTLKGKSDDIEAFALIDIPDELDGYKVSCVETAAFDAAQISGVYVPATVTELKDRAFSGCSSIQTVLLEEGLEKIGAEAFAGCTGLAQLQLPVSVTSIGDNAFEGIGSITLQGNDASVAQDYASNYDNVAAEETEPNVTSVHIEKTPDKTSYNMSEIAEPGEVDILDGKISPIDLTGIVLKATYDNGKEETVTDGIMAWFEEKEAGTCTIWVGYKGCCDSYQAEVANDDCEYTIFYEDEAGNQIAEPEKKTARSGISIVIECKDIKGYTPVEESVRVRIGADNYFVLEYVSDSAGVDDPDDPDDPDGEDQVFAQAVKNKIVYDGVSHADNVTAYNRTTHETLTLGEDYTVEWSEDKDEPTNIGAYYFEVTFIGEYAGYPSQAGSFRIIPGNTKIKSAKAGKKCIKLKLASLKGGVTYEIKYQTKGVAWKTKTTKNPNYTLKKLKSKKKYKIKVRAYKVVDGIYYTGDWTNPKTVKVK